MTDSTSPARGSTRGHLLRILGVGFGIAASLGGTLGVGILRAPGIVASHLPSPGLIIVAWLAGGVFAIMGTLCVIELGTSYPKAGGWYVYVRESFGDFPAFIVGWSFWLAVVSGLSYASIALGEYLSALIPAFHGHSYACGVGVLLLLVAFQFAGLKPVSRFQEVTGFLKGLVFLILAGACLFFTPSAAPTATTTAAAPPIPSITFFAVILALQAVIKTYDGWQTPCFFTEEDRNPTRNLPRAMLTGTTIIIVIYLAMNLALLRVLSVPEIGASKLAAADAFARIFGPITGKIITAIAVLNIAGLLNTLILAAARGLFAMSRDGLLFRSTSSVNDKGVPVLGTLISGAVALVLMSGGSFERVFGLSAFMAVVCYAAGYAALLVLRRKYPDRERPFKVWGYPYVPVIALVISVAFLIGAALQDLPSAALSAACVILAYPLFRYIRRNGPTPQSATAG